MTSRNKAVFLDRDGVINQLILNPATQMYESPNHPSEFIPCAGAAEALRMLKQNDYMLFVVSNQPSWAKGKTSHENLVEIDNNLLEWCLQENIELTERFYCFHHPDAVVPELKQLCKCRKPGTLFLENAEITFYVDMSSSWFVGDRITDIECGRKMGCKTIIVKSMEPVDVRKAGADFSADNLAEAARIIIRES